MTNLSNILTIASDKHVLAFISDQYFAGGTINVHLEFVRTVKELTLQCPRNIMRD